MSSLRGLIHTISVLCLLLTGACNSPPPDADSFERRDPVKPINRAVFSFNRGFDRAIVEARGKSISSFSFSRPHGGG